MSEYIVNKIRRELDVQNQRSGGMRVGMPKVSLNVSDVEALLQRHKLVQEKLATQQEEIGRLQEDSAALRDAIDRFGVIQKPEATNG